VRPVRSAALGFFHLLSPYLISSVHGGDPSVFLSTGRFPTRSFPDHIFTASFLPPLHGSPLVSFLHIKAPHAVINGANLPFFSSLCTNCNQHHHPVRDPPACSGGPCYIARSLCTSTPSFGFPRFEIPPPSVLSLFGVRPYPPHFSHWTM